MAIAPSMLLRVRGSVKMFSRPRRLLTSGTAAVAVAGAWLLAVEDAGLGPYTRAHVAAVGAASRLWEPSDQGVSSRPAVSRRKHADRDHDPSRH